MGLTDTFFRSGRTDQDALCRLIHELWQMVANGFRTDEVSVEAAHFHESTAAIAADLTALAPGAVPDLKLARRMLTALAPLLGERISDLHARLDELDATCQARDRELMTVKLASSWQSDELERCRKMLMQALRGRETVMPTVRSDGTAPLVTQLLSLLLDIEAPPPRPEASLGRRQETNAKAESPASASGRTPASINERNLGERALIVQVLHEVLAGTAHTPRLIRALEEPELAKQLATLAEEHRTYRGILQQIGVLPRA